MTTDRPQRAQATVAFVDLAGFSALTDVYGDTAAVEVIDRFTALVDQALTGDAPPVKWIGDEAMLAFPDPETAVTRLTVLLRACRSDPVLPLTRTGLTHGPLLHHRGDLFGTTVNVAARLTALAEPGQVLATGAPAVAAARLGHRTHRLGPVRVRSVATALDVHVLDLTEATQPAAVDPVCKMHAPHGRIAAGAGEPWFCAPRCADAFATAPDTYR